MRFWLGLLVLGVYATASQAQQSYLGYKAELDPNDCPADQHNWSQQALERILNAPLGLPQMPLPQDNTPTAAKIELGRKLFFDRRLSINGTMSCAMCHVPEQAFAVWELKTAVGVEGRSLKRNAPSLLNIGHFSPLFHDGRDFTLEAQYVGPLVARNEMANPSLGYVLHQIQGYEDYDPFFDQAFGDKASLDRIGQAIAHYQRSLVAGNSPFDQWYYGQDDSAISAAAQRGFALFDGKAQCSSCHIYNENDALFTDQEFHNIGYGEMREAKRQNPPQRLKVQVAPGDIREIDFGIVQSVGLKSEADLGRYEVTEDPQDRWHFRTPTLRNLTMTPPYMHDGHLRTLEEVIEFYNDGGLQSKNQDPRIRPLNLDDNEKADLLAFLETLTSSELECLTAEARTSPPDNL